MSFDNIDIYIKNLNKNPLFILSESSKELYHSNMLYWLMSNYGGYFAKIFGDFDEVKREHKIGKKSVDIALFKKGNIVAFVEVKVKDSLTKFQAKQYIDDSDRKYFLLSMFGNNPIDKWLQVRFTDINELASSIKENNIYHKSIIDLYCKMIQDINEIIKLQPTELNLRNLTGGYPRKLEKIRLSEAWKKYYANCIIEELTVPDFVEKSVSINNKKATLDFKVKVDGHKIGIQIEGKQVRRFIEFKGAEFEFYKKIWFEEKWKSPHKLECCRYDLKDNGLFLYQYQHEKSDGKIFDKNADQILDFNIKDLSDFLKIQFDFLQSNLKQ